MAGTGIRYIEQMKKQAIKLDEEADKVKVMHDAWKSSTIPMDDALPDAEARTSFHEAVEAMEGRLTEMETTLRSWATGFRNAAEVYERSDTYAAYTMQQVAGKQTVKYTDGGAAS